MRQADIDIGQSRLTQRGFVELCLAPFEWLVAISSSEVGLQACERCLDAVNAMACRACTTKGSVVGPALLSQCSGASPPFGLLRLGFTAAEASQKVVADEVSAPHLRPVAPLPLCYVDSLNRAVWDVLVGKLVHGAIDTMMHTYGLEFKWETELVTAWPVVGI